MTPKSRRFSPHLVAVAILLVLAASAFWWTLVRERERIDTIVVARGDIELSTSAMGTLQPRSYVDVGAQASGEIRRITVQAGSQVEKGQLLVEIDPAVQQAKVDTDRASYDSLRAQIDEQQANREFAQQQLARELRMQGEGSTRAADVQAAQNALSVAQARIASLRAQLDGAASTLKGDQAQLGYTRIYAPMRGTVITLDARAGQTLNATYQTPKIMRIADLSAMTVWTQVSEADIRHVRTGMQAWFSTLGDERRWRGVVRQLLPAPPNPAGGEAADGAKPASPASKVVLYTVLVDVDNADGALMPQMSAQVNFVDQSASDAVLVPLTALQPVDAKAGVYRAQVQLDDGQLIQREVRTGVRDRLQAQILSGLAPGDRLVTRRSTYRPIAGKVRW